MRLLGVRDLAELKQVASGSATRAFGANAEECDLRQLAKTDPDSFGEKHSGK